MDCQTLSHSYLKTQAERTARIAEELAGMGPSVRTLEGDSLAALLKPLGLAVREIRVRMPLERRAWKGMKEREEGGQP